MSTYFDAQKRWDNPTQEDLQVIDRLTSPNVPLEVSAGRLPSSGVGWTRTHHHKETSYDPQGERVDALRELAGDRLLEGSQLSGPEKQAAYIDFIRLAKAAAILDSSRQLRASGNSLGDVPQVQGTRRDVDLDR
jgi:hypothetical protein